MPLSSSKDLKVTGQLVSTIARERGETRLPKTEMLTSFTSQGVSILHEVKSLNQSVSES